MLFNKKKYIVELTRHYGFTFKKSKPEVKFKDVFDLTRECGLTVVDMSYRSGHHSMYDDFCTIIIGLKGTIQNLELFEVKALHNPKLKIFDNLED